ncbi:MAG: hypothetical protein EBZ69_00010 [Alphaproteobacteria bacterium]|nr:hypothetical protein [Alphaproteobacteria bacterium]
MIVDIILAELNDRNPDAYLFENMNDALVGLGSVAHKDPVAIYSQQKILNKLLADGFSQEDAEEYFSKFIGIWVGDKTPVIINDIME